MCVTPTLKALCAHSSLKATARCAAKGAAISRRQQTAHPGAQGCGDGDGEFMM